MKVLLKKDIYGSYKQYTRPTEISQKLRYALLKKRKKKRIKEEDAHQRYPNTALIKKKINMGEV